MRMMKYTGADLVGRSGSIRIFISSKMRGNALAKERHAAAAAIRSMSYEPWWWEENAPIGLSYAEDACIKFAASSDGLVLILEDEITPITRREYEAAKAAGVICFIFVREPSDNQPLSQEVQDFISAQRNDKMIDGKFSTSDELATRLTSALRQAGNAFWRATIGANRGDWVPFQVDANSLQTYLAATTYAIEHALWQGQTRIANVLAESELLRAGAHRTESEEYAWYLNSQGLTLTHSGQQSKAKDVFTQMLNMGDKLQSQSVRAIALQNLGNLETDAGNYIEARELYRQSVYLLRELEDDHGMLQLVLNCITIEVELGDLDVARDLIGHVEDLIEYVSDAHLWFSYHHRLGLLAAREEDYRSSLLAFRKAKRYAKKSGDVAAEVTAAQNIGKALFDQGKPRKALLAYQDCIALLAHGEWPELSILVHRSIAEAFIALGRRPDAAVSLDEAIDIAQSFGLSDAETGLTLNLAGLHYDAEDFTSARDYFDRAKEVASRDSDTLSQAWANAGLAAIALRMGLPYADLVEQFDGTFDEASVRSVKESTTIFMIVADAALSNLSTADLGIDLIQRAVDEIDSDAWRPTIAQDVAQIGAKLSEVGDPKHAAACFKISRKLFLDIGDDVMLFHVTNDLANQLVQLHDYEEAHLRYAECIRMAEARVDRVMLGLVLANNAELLRREGATEEAIANASRSLDLSHQVGDRQNEAFVRGTLGLCLSEANRWDEAEHHFREARRLARQLRDTRSEALATGGLGGVAFTRKHFGRAARYYEKAVALTESDQGSVVQHTENLAGLLESLIANMADRYELVVQRLVTFAQANGTTLTAAEGLARSARWFLVSDQLEDAVELYALSVLVAAAGRGEQRSIEEIFEDIPSPIVLIGRHLHDAGKDYAAAAVPALAKRIEQQASGLGEAVQTLIETVLLALSEHSQPGSS